MDQTYSLRMQGREVTPKNEKAHVQNGLGNQANLNPDYTSTKPKKLSTARLSSYWLAFVGGEVRNV